MELVKTIQPALVEGAHSKKDIAKLADAIVGETLEKGTVLEMVEKIAATEELIKQMKSDERFKSYALDQIAAHGKYVSESGTKVEACEVGTKYHFDKCGDVELFLLEQRAESANNAVKERQEFLKKVPASGLDVVDPISGEVYKVYPPYKTSTSSYKVTLSK